MNLTTSNLYFRATNLKQEGGIDGHFRPLQYPGTYCQAGKIRSFCSATFFTFSGCTNTLFYPF